MEVESLVPAPRSNSFIETRLDLDAIDPAPSIAHIQVPSTSAFSRQTRPIVKRANERAASKDEAEFHKRNAATAASIFFRASVEEAEGTYPRAISWRVIDSASTLEVRALDLTRTESQPDRIDQVLRYVFPSHIRSGGVALAESSSSGAISAFVMTKNHDLYTLVLHPSFFSLPLPSGEDVESSLQYFRPSALSISTFYKLFAPSALVVLISLGDGRLTRLSRKEGENGSQWTERTYDDGQWAASFRGLLPWHPKPTVQHEGSTLNRKTIHLATLSPNHEHVFTTGLDHTLKAWNLSTGKPTIVRDLLDQPLPEDGLSKNTLDPGTATSLRIFESRSGGGYTYYAITFSPQKSGVFKIWAIADPDDAEHGIRDCFDDKELRLPDSGDGALWTLSDFDILSSADTSEIEVWMLMRLNSRFQLFYRRFHDINNLGEEWQLGWEATIVDHRHKRPSISPGQESIDQADLTAKWLDYLFRPDHIPRKVIDTSLSVYMQTKGERAKKSKGSLPDQVVAAITSQIPRHSSVPRNSGSDTVGAASKEWSNFWNIVRDVNSLRWEPISLSINNAEATPWIAFADGFSVVRDCSDLELLSYNDPETLEDASFSRVIPSIEVTNPNTSNTKEQASVISTAAAFRSSFPLRLQHACEQAFDEDLYTDPLKSPWERMQDLYDRCNFAEDVTSRQFEDLRSSLDHVGGFAGLRAFHLLALSENQPSRKEPNLSFSRIGLGALVCGAHDMITLQLRVLQDLLYLLVFVFGELDPAEELAEALEPEQTFLTLIEQLKRAKLASWLATKSRPSSVKMVDENLDMRPPIMTVLRDFFALDIKPHVEDVKDGRSELTQAMQHLLIWVAGNNELSLNDVVINIQCNLLKNRNLELAVSFQQFLPSTAWSFYIQGRLCLMQEEFAEAADLFRHAAFKLCRPDPPPSAYELPSSGLLNSNDASFFASGLSRFYFHILCLFETSRAHVHAVAFARLALQHLHESSSEQEWVSEILNRLFHSALALGDFDSAAAAMNRIPDQAVQRAALRELVARIVESGAVKELLHLPFPNLQKDVDALLAERARSEGQRGTVGPSRIPYFRILYAWRLRLGDVRGAAAVLIERLENVKQQNGSQASRGGIGASTSIKQNQQALDEYLVAINALALAGDQRRTGRTAGDEGWVFIETQGKPRRVVRLQDLRTSYGEEMDHQGMLEMGRFGIVDYDDDEGMDLQA